MLLQKGIVNLLYENLPAVVEFWIEISQPYLKISSSKNLNVECEYAIILSIINKIFFFNFS